MKQKKLEKEQEYRAQKEKVNEMMDTLEAEEVKKIIHKNGVEGIDFWKTMKKIKKKAPVYTKIRKENGEITEDSEEILEEKRKYFQKLYSKQPQTEEQSLEEKKIIERMEKLFKEGSDLEINRRISTEEVEKSIKRSKDGAPGPDEITNMMMKKSIDIIKTPLTDIVNNIKENKNGFPTTWELGDIISFFKGKGDPYDLTYQRGISLTSCVLKTLENVVGCRIEPVIREESTPLQGGGKKGESPEEYIFALQTIIDKNKQRRKATKIIITDVEKAFDQAWRIGVFENLMNRGIKGEILQYGK
jgi:hypothetical protein